VSNRRGSICTDFESKFSSNDLKIKYNNLLKTVENLNLKLVIQMESNSDQLKNINNALNEIKNLNNKLNDVTNEKIMLEYKLTQMTSNEKKLLKEISRMEVELKSLKPENGQFDVCKLNFIFISLNKNQKE